MKKNVFFISFLLIILLLVSCSQSTDSISTPTTPSTTENSTSDNNSTGNEDSTSDNNSTGSDNLVKKKLKRVHLNIIKADQSQGSEITWEYDEEGNLSKDTIDYHNKRVQILITNYDNEYDSKGFLIKTTVTEGTVSWITDYENNDNGIPIKSITTYNSKKRDVNFYNDKGYLIKVTQYENNKCISTTTFEVDENGNEIKSVSKDYLGNSAITTWEYNNKNFYELIKMDYEYNGEMLSQKSYTYTFKLDSFRNVIKLERIDELGEKSIFEYEYWD